MGVDKLEEKGCEHPFLGGGPGKIDIEIYLTGLFASVPFSETLSKRIEEDSRAVVGNNYMVFGDRNPSL